MATFERHEGRNLKGIDLDSKDRDLEQYGVWVKAEPQDVFEEPEGDVFAPIAETPGEMTVQDESFLSEEDESLLGTQEETSDDSLGDYSTKREIPSLDLEEASISIPELEEASVEEGANIPNIPDIGEFESMEDLGVPIEEFTPESSGSSPSVSETEFQDVSDFSMDEPSPVLGESVSTDFEPIDIDLKFDDTLPPRPSPKGGSVAQRVQPTQDGFETVTDFDDFLNSPETEESPEPQDAVLELAGEPESEKPSTNGPAPSDGDFSLDDIPEFSSEPDIDDVAELEKQLSTHADRTQRTAAAFQPDSSSDVLLKIAGELSSIKQELVSLKTQIAAIKAESSGMRPETSAEENKPGSGKPRGFFDEEEDETIALTGDELDNILNTAEFSEESADTHQSEDDETSEASLEDLLPESGDYAPASEATGPEPVIEEIRLTSEEKKAQSPGAESPEDEISMLADEGVSPLSPLPEDTTYLETETENEDSLSSGTELPEAPLLEPTPEELNIDDLVDEDYEDAEELPLAEFESPNDLTEPEDLVEESEELEELTLDLESEPNDIVLEAPGHVEMPIAETEDGATEGSEEPFEEFVEELPVEEDSEGFGEIALHDETPYSQAPAEEEEQPLQGEEAVALIEEELPVLEEASEAPPMEPEALADENATSEDLLVEDLEPAPQGSAPIPNRIKDEVRSVLSYLDKLLESLPEEKIEEFAKSEHFETYKRLFEELGLV